jgi:hypothetical protein
MLKEAMTLMDAKQYDPSRDRKRRNIITVSVIVLLILGWVAYHFRDYPERAEVGRFFAALQKQDYEGAYAIWFHDPGWKQHEAKYSAYQYNDFYRDWGPGGEWGLIKSYMVDCSISPGSGSGVVVQVTVNQRTEHAYVWVEKSDKTLSFSPTEIDCGNWWGWLTE